MFTDFLNWIDWKKLHLSFLSEKTTMSNKKSVIIIGAGIGGLATAVKMAQCGYDVKVYEKNAAAGGRCSQIIRDGHRFDLGATILLMPSIYRSVFEWLGLKLEDCFEITTLPTIYTLYFEDGDKIAFTTDQEKMRSQIESIEPGSFIKYKKYVSNGYDFFQTSV